MSKAQLTKQHIIERSAEVFNQFGYAGTSMAALMAATSLKKGGIYNHFASKDELAIAAFNYSVSIVQQKYADALQGERLAVNRLQAIIETFCVTVAQEPALKGGCPLMNTAVDSDDAHEGLKMQAQAAMDRWRKMLAKIVRYGQKRDEIVQRADPDEVATILISTLEGAVMMSGLYGDRVHLDRARTHLLSYVETLRHPP